MKISPSLDRRRFVQLGALAAGSALFSGRAVAATPGGFTLPPLPYKFDALEPSIDARTMEIHHDKHHAGYVAGLNAALASAPTLRSQSLKQLLASLPDVADANLRTSLRNSGGGHWNHSFFWDTLTPVASSGAPSAKLAAAIKSNYVSIDGFKQAFTQAATKRFGSGWAWLIVQGGKLQITSTPNQDNPLMKGLVPDAELGTPLLGLDVWEHAYYLHYQNRRADYITAWWSIVNWQAVSDRFEAAAQST